MTNTNKIPDMPTVIEVDGVEYDLTKLDQKLEDLPIEVRVEVFRWWQLGGDIDLFDILDDEWINIEHPCFASHIRYRITTPRIEPEYPWEILQDWVQWCVVDEDGRSWGSERSPASEHGFFIVSGSKYADLGAINFERGNLHWTETLRKRPEGV